MDDVIQGYKVGNCYQIAHLGALAKADPRHIRRMVVALGDGTFAVRFYDEGKERFVRVDADLWVRPNGSPYAAGLGLEESLWVAIIEKAYAFYRKRGESSEGTYESLKWGIGQPNFYTQKTQWEIGDGLTQQDVLDWVNDGAPAGQIEDTIHTSVIELLGWIKSELDNGHPLKMGAISTLSNDKPIQSHYYRRGQHAFIIDSVEVDAAGTPAGLVLRNPFYRDRADLVTLTDFTRIHYFIGRAFYDEPRYAMVGSIGETCYSNEQCGSEAHCSVSHRCVPNLGTGQAGDYCDADTQCQSGVCDPSWITDGSLVLEDSEHCL
jgi:hypothetical protein